MSGPHSPALGYWMHETGGVLRPAVEAYLLARPMSPEQIAALRAYLRQWIEAPVWRGLGIAELRARIDDAETLGIDPL